MTEAPGYSFTKFRRIGTENGDARCEEQAGGFGERDVQPTLETICASSFAQREFRERPWLVKNLIPDRNVTLLGGDGAVGKSLLAQQLAVATAAARDWIGQLPAPGPVLYVSAEDDLDEVHRRIVDITSAADIEIASLADLHVVPLAGKNAVLAAPDTRSDLIAATPLWQALIAKVQQLRPRLLILDNLADIFAGNENSRPQARQFVGMMRGLAIEFELAGVIISHPSLTGISSGTGTSGSTAWSNSVRSRLYLDRVKVDGGEADADLRILKVLKANYSPVGAEIRIRWEKGRFRLESGTSGGFDRAASQAKADGLFLDLLRAFDQQGREVSPNLSNAYAPTVFAGHPDAAGVGKRQFADAMNRLFKAGNIKSEKVGPPSKKKVKIVAA